MAIVTEYICRDCKLELVDDGRVFILNDSNETEDFLILMSTCSLLNGAKVRGNVDVTYCRECDKFLRVYTITEVQDGIENPVEIVRDGIKKYIDSQVAELERLKKIRQNTNYEIESQEDYYVVTIPEWENFIYSSDLWPEMSRDEVIRNALNNFREEIDGWIEYHEEEFSRFDNSNFLVLDESGNDNREFDYLEKVACPECGSEVNKYVDPRLPCPRCGGEMSTSSAICYD